MSIGEKLVVLFNSYFIGYGVNIIDLIAGLIFVVEQQHEVLSVCYQTGLNWVWGDESDTFHCFLKQSDSNNHELLTLTRLAISTMVAWQLRFLPVALLAAGGVVFHEQGDLPRHIASLLFEQ